LRTSLPAAAATTISTAAPAGRPALRQLLADIEGGKIDVVVIYKIDRLTRSLADFARIIEVLEKGNASFVSVTQSFNTKTSMGRLMLHVLLSFAQFEREVGAERVRDKVAASKAKGMWMGGMVLFGYDALERKLMVNKVEAATVKALFQKFVELRSVPALLAWSHQQGLRTKQRLRDGQMIGGARSAMERSATCLVTEPIAARSVTKVGSMPGSMRPSWISACSMR